VNKAVEPDNIPPYYLRIAANIISPYLHYFFEYSFNHGIFPENCKLAKVILLHKKGDKIKPTNYRPISILTCFSKILERLIYNKFIKFFTKHRVIHKAQMFPKEPLYFTCSSRHCHYFFSKQTQQQLYRVLTQLDLQKAFDCVSHNILLAK